MTINRYGKQEMIKRFFKDIREYAFFCRYMARTSLKEEVANSYLNWIWWVLEPLASMAIYYVIFVNILGRDQLYYGAFIYSGTLIWSYFDRCMLFAVSAVRLNRDIVTKTYIPKPILLIYNMLFNDIKIAISLVFLIILMAIQRVVITPYILYVIPMAILIHLLVFGFGLIFMHFGVFVDDLAHATPIAMRILFFLTGIFYDLKTILPEPWGSILIRINPFAAAIYNTRAALLYGQSPEFITVGIWFVLAIALCLLGLHLSYKYENTYVKVI